MKSIISKTIALLAISVALLSFTSKPGGEGFEIFLNNKPILQQFGKDINTVKSLQLSSSSANDMLTIKYYHCGRVGNNRVVTIRDEHNTILKQFHFTDSFIPVAAMDIPLKDILGLKKGTVTLNLYYSSSELPKGRVLASINATGVNRTAPCHK